MKTNRWLGILGILLLFILPIVSFFLLQNQSGEKALWNAAIGIMILLIGVLIIILAENVAKSLWFWLQKLKIMSDILEVGKEKKQKKEDKDDLQGKSVVPFPPSDVSVASGADEKQVKKKKVENFENYDQLVENYIRDQWNLLKRRDNAKEEENELRMIAMRLKTKRYDDADDWIWIFRNYFRARPKRLQNLLFEIKGRLKELEHIKKLNIAGTEDSLRHSLPSHPPPPSSDTDNSQLPESPTSQGTERILTNVLPPTSEPTLPPPSLQNTKRIRAKKNDHKQPKSKSTSVSPSQSTERDVLNVPDQTNPSELPSGDEPIRQNGLTSQGK